METHEEPIKSADAASNDNSHTEPAVLEITVSYKPLLD